MPSPKRIWTLRSFPSGRGPLAFGAFKDSTKSSAANKTAAKNQNASQVANMLQADQPQLIRHEGADSGGKLLAMRQPSPIEENDMTGGEVASENPVKDSRIKPAAKSRPPQSGESQAAAVEAPRREPGTRQSEAVAPESSEALKSAFLAATGRAKPATDTQIEERQTQAVEQVTPRAHAAPPMETPIRRAQAAYAGVAEYTVGRGDNAHLISSRLGVSYAELAAANNLASPRDLRVGQKLVVPREQGGSM
jgi:LysM repeat protein